MDNDIETIKYEIGVLENKHIFQLAYLRLLDEAVKSHQQSRPSDSSTIRSGRFSKDYIGNFFL
jgi:hypothetical protein